MDGRIVGLNVGFRVGGGLATTDGEVVDGLGTGFRVGETVTGLDTGAGVGFEAGAEVEISCSTTVPFVGFATGLRVGDVTAELTITSESPNKSSIDSHKTLEL